MTFLTPLAALVGLAAGLPLAAALLGRVRVDVVRRTLGLEAASVRAGLLRPALGAAGIVLLGLAAAQPVLEHRSSQRVRKDVQALFVLDTSRSMAASATATSPTRLDRAIGAAVRLRSSIPEVPSGVATLTDRVLPDLLPVAGTDSFDAVVRRAVAIESPPPQDSSVRATAYDKLAQIASGNYFDPKASRKIVVLLTDGESNAIDAGQIARDLPTAKGYRFVSVRFWSGRESVFDAKGKPEADYRPDPSGGALLAGLAAATGGKAFSESRLGGASSTLVRDAGSGPTTVAAGETQSRFALAPFLAAAAILLLLAAVLPFPRGSVAGGRVDQRV
jgi:von Willebrand factor type A domain